ncbi:TolB family protein [Nonomuraea sp. NPDC048826]|uniref:TolB family protein n=1 Tax=Nonomuraea sp. NPDC048826 TaxID=3364347 RepID=UPI0037153BD5
MRPTLTPLILVLVLVAPSPPAAAGKLVTDLVNVTPAGQQAVGLSRWPDLTESGAVLAFDSLATDLVPADTNDARDVFVRNTAIPATVRASVSSGGVQGDNDSETPSIDAHAHYVAYESRATNLVPGDTNGVSDVFVFDVWQGKTVRVSVTDAEGQADARSGDPAINKDGGRYVAFFSTASNLVPGDVNGVGDVFVRDLRLGTTTLVSVSDGSTRGTGESYHPAISEDGRWVAFTSDAANLVAGDTNGVADVFLRDLRTGTTSRISVSGTGQQADGSSALPSIRGTSVAFTSRATNLVAGDTNGVQDVFVHHRTSGGTIRVSVGTGGTQANAPSTNPSMGDYTYVAFSSGATNLVAGDTNGVDDVFRHNRVSGVTDRWSVESTGGQTGLGPAGQPMINGIGGSVAFVSSAVGFFPGDPVNTQDVFLRHP